MILNLIMRNAGEIEQSTSLKALEPATIDVAADLRAKAAKGIVPEVDFDIWASAATAVAAELSFRHIRSREGVERATEFATRLFLGAIERASVRDAWRSGSIGARRSSLFTWSAE